MPSGLYDSTREESPHAPTRVKTETLAFGLGTVVAVALGPHSRP